jgi:Family of unknown function (DUF5906)
MGKNVEQFEDFWAHRPSAQFIYAPTRELWPPSSVNAALPRIPVLNKNGTPVINKKGEPKTVGASVVIARERGVQQATWAPGEPMLICDRLVNEGGWLVHKGARCFNLYLPPPKIRGNPKAVKPWLDHVRRVYPDDADHIIRWCAHRVQHPHVKINHAIVLGGEQGIGKDTLLEPVKFAIGHWNFSEVGPQQLVGRFNGFLKSVILRVNEARDLGEVNRYSFYDHTKTFIAEPPDVLRVDEKNLREHYILNCVGVVMTTNHKTNGIFLPPDDRRHYVAWSDLTKEDFTEAYWQKLWGWFRRGGNRNVAAYLAAFDLSTFDPKAPPPKTAAWWSIVDANRAPEEAELADVLDKLGNPDAVTLDQVIDAVNCGGDFYDWLTDRKNRRAVPHRFERGGYVPVRNDTREDGLWVISGARCVVYAKQTLSLRDQLKAARDLQREADEKVRKNQEKEAAAAKKRANGPRSAPRL